MLDQTHQVNSGFLSSVLDDLQSQRVHDPFRLAAIVRQSDRVAKKLRTDNIELDAKAIGDFIRENSEVKDILPNLNDYVLGEARTFIVTALERFTSSYCDSIQCNLDLGLLMSLWRFGPGANYGVKGTHFVDKIMQPWTVTERARPLARLMRKLCPHLRFNDESKGCCGTVVVRGSRLGTVPKNAETARTIATEPSGNMALQLAAGGYVEGALRRVGFDIRKQEPKNKELAHRGSIDGSLATIDLKSASNYITPALIELLWPSEWKHLFSQIRSPEIDILGEWHTLHMQSTMGNGFTFPVMTLTLLSLCYAVSRIRLRSKYMVLDSSKFAVYGDDIICPSAVYEELCGVIGCCGLVVNSTKSYSTGYFRESCGGDYFKGYDITPFYVKSLTADPEVYVAINQVMKWSSKHQIMMPKTLTFLRGLLRTCYLVPEWEDPSSGILTAQVSRHYKLYSVVPNRVTRRIPYDLLMLCILGGYVDSDRNSAVYTPRSSDVKYTVKKKALPSGWVTGRCQDSFDDEEHSYKELLITLFIVT